MALSTVNFFLFHEGVSGFGLDPDPDGSDYLAAQIIGKPFYSNDKKASPTNYATGRNRATKTIVGPDAAGELVDFALISNATVFADAGSIAAKDWFDYLLDAALGASTVVNAEGLAAGGNTTTVVMDTDTVNVEDLVAVNFSNRTEWRSVTVDSGGGTYTVAPALTASPDAARDAIGYRYWTQTDTPGATVTCYTQIGGNGYRLSGGRPSLKISAVAGAEWMKATAGFKFDGKYRETKASLNPVSQFTNTPMKAVLSPILWGSTSLSWKMVEIDFQATPTNIPNGAGTNGNQSIDNLSWIPRITMEVPFSTSLEDDFDNETERTLLIQLGSGLIAGGRANTMCFFAQAAQIVAIQPSDDGNYLRQKVTFEVKDAGIRTGTTPYRYWTLARG